MRGLETRRVRVERKEGERTTLSHDEVAEAYRAICADIRDFLWLPRPDETLQKRLTEISAGAKRGGVDEDAVKAAVQNEAKETSLFLSVILKQDGGFADGASAALSLFQSHFLPDTRASPPEEDDAAPGEETLSLPESILEHVSEDLIEHYLMSIFTRVYEKSAEDRLERAARNIALAREQFGLTETIEEFIANREPLRERLHKMMISFVVNHSGASSLRDIVAVLAPIEGLSAYQPVLQGSLDFFYHHSSRWKDRSVQQFSDTFLGGVDIIEHFMQRYRDDVDNWRWESISLLRNANRRTQDILNDALREQAAVAIDDVAPERDRLEAISNLRVANRKLGGVSDVIKDIAKIARQPVGSADETSPVRESAVQALLESPLQSSNEALADMLVSGGTDSTTRHAIIRKFLQEENEWLREGTKTFLRSWFSGQPHNDTDWRDLQFMDFLHAGDSGHTDTVNKATASLALLKGFDFSSFPLFKRWEERYHNIPKPIFMQLTVFSYVSGEYHLLNTFQDFFARDREDAVVDRLFCSIVDVLHADLNTVHALGASMRQVTLETETDIDHLLNIFSQVAFLDTALQSLKEDAEWYDDSKDRQDLIEALRSSYTEEHLTAFDEGSLEAVSRRADESVYRCLERVLPHPDIDEKRSKKLFESWGSFEPFLTYLSKFPSTRNYVAEIAAHTDTQKDWKSWRYSERRNPKIVEEQIGHLSEEQLSLWKRDQTVDVGDVVLSSGAERKREKIYHLIQDAVLRDKHIYDEDARREERKVADKRIQGIIETVLRQVASDPDGKDAFIKTTLNRVQDDARAIDAVTKHSTISNLKQWVSMLSEEEVKPGSTTKNAVNRVSQFLPIPLRKEMQARYRVLERGEAVPIMTDDIASAIDESVQRIERQYASVRSSDLFDRLDLDEKRMRDRKQFYEKREELRVIENILSILSLTDENIATNRIANGLREETVETALKRLKDYFGKKNGKDPSPERPFCSVLENIESVLREGTEIGRKHRLGILFTDDPRVLFNTGKYPKGGLSCLQYDTKNIFSKKLLGFVGDPNCKVVYAIDLDALPNDTWENVKRDGLKQEDILPILEASVSRSAIKVVRDAKEERPALLIEPSYSSSGIDVNAFFDLFVQSMVSQRMQVPVFREGGQEKVIVGQSLSPEGRYDDTNPNTVHSL